MRSAFLYGRALGFWRMNGTLGAYISAGEVMGMLALVSAVVGALVGAGFASGRELETFFVAFGAWGFWGIGLMTVLFCAGGLLLLWLCQRLQLDSYQALLAAIFPPLWARVFDLLVSLGLWMGLGMMLVGCGTLGQLLMGWPQWAGFALGLVFTFLPLCRGGEGFLKVNGLSLIHI